jgi:hypothetical protein
MSSPAVPSLIRRPDPVAEEITAALRVLEDGRITRARRRLTELWSQLAGSSSTPHRSAVAHWLADAQSEVADELAWDERALAEAEALPEWSVPFAGTGHTVAAMYPQLHLALAEDYRRLDDAYGALEHLALARTSLSGLGEAAVGAWVRYSWDSWEEFWSDTGPG